MCAVGMGKREEGGKNTFGIEEVIRFDPWGICGDEEGGKWREDLADTEDGRICSVVEGGVGGRAPVRKKEVVFRREFGESDERSKFAALSGGIPAVGPAWQLTGTRVMENDLPGGKP